MQLSAVAAARYHAFKRKPSMHIESTKKLFTVDEYYSMAEAGILGPEDRVELIAGEIFQMSPLGNRHVGCVNRGNRLFITAFVGRAVVNIQNPVQLNNNTEPEPDIALLKFRSDDYAGKKVRAEDVLLIVEVSDTTLRFDRNVKLPLYALAGIPETWIENLENDELLVYRDPEGNGYRTAFTLHRGDSVSIAGFPDVVFKVDDLLGVV
jgi:Uma2 family endonuclease